MDNMFDFISAARASVAAGNRASSVSYNLDLHEMEPVHRDYRDTSYQMVDDVRIVPEKLVFNDAYDGKIFKSCFTIINCGKYPAFVRIMPPGSKLFLMKAVPKGVTLSAGLSLTRTITYTHKSAMLLPQAYLFIYINEQRVSYQLEVHLISPFITLTPSILDFGELDVGNSSQQLTIHLINKGHRVANFAVDLGRNDLEVIVEPMKGSVEPSKEVEMTVEVLGSQLGSFRKEFWIKTEPPRRVKIQGVFIPPKLILEYPFSSFYLKMIDFPRTYYGAKSTRTLIIQNRSSTNSMFCTVAECGENYDILSKVRETNPNLQCFFVSPKEGRLQAQEKYILQYSFEPKKIKGFHRKYCIALIKILKINYRDGFVVEKDVEVKTFPSAMRLEPYSVASLQSIEDYFTDLKPVASYIRICLYGEMEEACVRLTPTVFHKNYLKLHESHECELDITNNSKYLPIIVKYVKQTCIEVEPKEANLGPNCNIEARLLIKPLKIGEVCTKIKFDLIYHNVYNNEYHKVGTTYISVKYSATMTPPKLKPKFNMGITPMITNEVGCFVDDVRFNTIIKKPRQAIVNKQFNNTNNALIAFPNDRPKSLRPWRNKIPICTIFANIPRVTTNIDEYGLNTAELEAKQFTKNVYSTYLQASAKRRQTELIPLHTKPDYITDEKRLLLSNLASHQDVVDKPTTLYGYIPLPPEVLMNVIIEAKYVQLGEIAPYTSCTDCFTIENRNEFGIMVSIKALNNSVVIKEKKRMVIEAKKIKNICFDCFSNGLGKYYVPVFIIVNNFHIFDATVFAKVVPTTVKCNFEEIVIDPKTNKSLFEIHNPVNCNITFCWEVQDHNFDVRPKSGIIPPRRSIYCAIVFIPQLFAIYKTEIYLMSQSGAKQVIAVSLKTSQASIGFDTQAVKFENIPLNMPVSRNLILRNFSDEKIMYQILNPNPMEEITIEPTQGEIFPKSDMHFVITAHFQTVVEFNCSIKFTIQDLYVHIVNIEGSIVYPCIKLEPNYMQIEKVTSGAYIRRVFRVTNMSEIQTLIYFPLEDIPEFFITDMDKNYIRKAIALEPNEARELFLEFKPTEPVAYSIFLPYIINGIIGPPALNDPASLNPKNYFKKDEENDSLFKCHVSLPENLPTISIRCAAGVPWFKFSSLHLHLYAVDTKREKYFTIKNISTIQHQVTIPVIDPKSPIRFQLEKASNYEMKKDFHKAIIEPEEAITFKMEFNPPEYGNYEIDLPIFVEKYFEKCPFNHLKLSGSNPKPVISCKHSLHFYSIWVREKISETITLNLIAHKDDCKIITKVDHPALSITFLEKDIVTRYQSKIIYLVTFDPKEECFIDHEIIFSCTCCSDSTCSLFVKACADDTSFVSYHCLFKSQALRSQKVVSTFPYFPEIKNLSYYADNMRMLLAFLEKWIFSQGFFFKNFFKIPYGISSFPVNIEPLYLKGKKGCKKSDSILPLIHLLANLVDTSVFKYIRESNVTPSYEDVEGTIYVYVTYRNTISFLKSQGVFIPQLKPEHLLPYDKYMIFNERVTSDQSNEKPFNKEDFHLFSKQCWVDLLIKIYKVFVFNRVTNPTPMIYKGKSKIPPQTDIYREEFMQYFSENIKYVTNRCENEAKLLLWLEFHFEKQKFVLWNSESIKKPRKIRSFHDDLWDSLPFATLMLSYCPYMLNNLKNFYPDYQNNEQIFHNACLIFECWRKINLSFELAPEIIVKPNTIEMIFLVTYLYDVLPNFYPTETITLEASLGETAVNDVILKNHGNATISYTVQFFSNDLNIFQVDSKTITIPPKKEKKMKITYIAKNVTPHTAVLVLSGETAGYKFSRSMAITLVGTPSIFKFFLEITINVDTYERVRKKLNISSPYERAYVADVCFHIGEASYFQSVNQFVPANTLELAPMQMNVDTRTTFDEDGDAIMRISLCYLISGTFTYFIYFVNDEIGDFCIKVTVMSVLPKENTLDEKVILPSYFDPSGSCTCSNSTNIKGSDLKLNCPKIFTVEIPCRNNQLFDGLRSMLEYFCDENEFKFWKALLEYPKGLHVLRNYIRNTYDERLIKYGNALMPSVTYDLGLSNCISGPEKVTLDKVSTDDTYTLTLHWNGDGIPEKEVLVLTAEHGQEIRQYKLIFVVPKEVYDRVQENVENSMEKIVV